ncbi:hypothetical protein HELRODRAFT_70969, partial [Helobdella robusta]|uniref:Phospholipid-transporting ATPase n=1 Tax=Helobdella robusta TaxID=6412 RepID=T1G0F1_HELRO
EITRIVRANDPLFNQSFLYPTNVIRTSKYNIITFLPKNLFEQFQRVANAYFLFLLVLQSIPQISSLTYVTTVIPLLSVLSVTALKDLYDDIQRHRSDRNINNRICKVAQNNGFIDVQWKELAVGDVVVLFDNHFVPADMLLLSSSEPCGLAYVETADLDGETNLKNKQSMLSTSYLSNDVSKLSRFNGLVECDPPNNVLDKFNGRLIVEKHNESHAITNGNILLRGCTLRNTKWVSGLLIYTGKDTKLMKNAGRTIFKRTHIDQLMNKLIIWIFFFLLFICFICCIGCAVWEFNVGFYYQVYLPWPQYVPASVLRSDHNEKLAGVVVTSLLVFLSYIIIMNTLVPISLYVSVEIIRFTQSLFINWDIGMYHKQSNKAAKARTTALNEELGQIEYIFSDKTGTLTQNIMTFKQCSVLGIKHSIEDLLSLYGETNDKREASNPIIPYGNDKTFLKNEKKSMIEFFRVIAVCHTVLSTVDGDKLTYQAQSPDESALVEAARQLGIKFLTRTQTTITIEVFGEVETHELLCILDFDNDRKRMSVILKRNNQITLYCKGADSKVLERLDVSSNNMMKITETHLNDYASEGLRTLCLAVKNITANEYRVWHEEYHKANTTILNRDKYVSEACEKVECNLTLLGATAIEDKLQDGVPQAIATLRLAGIKIWVLTGDKQETAINISYSCKLLSEEMTKELFIIDGDTQNEVKNQIEIVEQTFKSYSTNEEISSKLTNEYYPQFSGKSFLEKWITRFTSSFPDFALVVTGSSLTHLLSTDLEEKFLKIGCSCSSVICCRVTPLQKSQVVNLVKVHRKAVTLAIGDGANDVSMIKSAHIGVGISGQEGMQAALSSDYSFGQFRYLERLLLVHGRWSYIRMTKFLKFFFYKNFAFTLCQFWYVFYSGYSAQTIYDPFFVSFYNLFYTSLPILAVGVFEKDSDDEIYQNYPKLYEPGQKNLYFSKKSFAKSTLEGLVTSFVIYYVTMLTMMHLISGDGGTELSDANGMGFTMSSTVVVVVTFKCALETKHWTLINHLFIWGSLVFYFLFNFIFYLPVFKYSYAGTFTKLASSPQYWLSMMLSCAILLIPPFLYKGYCAVVHPTLAERLRIACRKNRSKVKPALDKMSARPSSRSSRPRSGYAFSHQGGFGELITKGSVFNLRDGL